MGQLVEVLGPPKRDWHEAHESWPWSRSRQHRDGSNTRATTQLRGTGGDFGMPAQPGTFASTRHPKTSPVSGAVLPETQCRTYLRRDLRQKSVLHLRTYEQWREVSVESRHRPPI